MPIIPLKCPICGADLEINSDNDAALCSACGSPFVVKDAIVKNYISNVTNINLNGGTVNVFNEKDFVIKAGVLEKYNGEDTDLTIPANVKEIGREAFKGYKYLTSVEIPDGVTRIGNHAFAYSGLEEVTIPDSVTGIGYSAFCSCRALKSVTIGNSVTKGNSVTYIGSDAFKNCITLTRVTIGENVTSLGWGAFSGCTSLQSVTIPDSVTRIEEEAFSGCGALESVTIGNRVTRIGKYAFKDCITLSNITLRKWGKKFLNAFDQQQRVYFMKQYNICPFCGVKDSFDLSGKCKSCGKNKEEVLK